MVSGTGCVSDRAVGSGALLGGRGSLPDGSSFLPSGQRDLTAPWEECRTELSRDQAAAAGERDPH